MKKGFTLIELLAVIVILAIIALIATPIILNIIGDSKEEATLRSAENYLDAVTQSIARKNINTEFNPSTCDVQSDGNLVCDAGNLTIEVDGEKPTSGTITFNNGKVDTVSNLKYGDNTVSTDENGKLVLGESSVEEVKVYKTLTTGNDFNNKIKALATNPTNITLMKFLSNGNLPSGYTKETLASLTSVDVSANNDGSVMAYYDGNGAIYVYSEDYITGNENCAGMFATYPFLTNLDVSELDTSNVTNMSAMFGNLVKLTSIDLSNFNTQNVENMSYMFQNNAALTTIKLENWNTSNVTNMSQMFNGCSSLTSLNLENWNTSKVTTMDATFANCTNLKSLNLSNFSLDSITTANGLFGNCTNLQCVQVGSNWDKSKETTDMFSNAGVTSTQTTACSVAN